MGKGEAMSILPMVERCVIFKEFSPEEQVKYFAIHSHKSLHHIDTLYYAVYLNEPDDIVERQEQKRLPAYLDEFIYQMRQAKQFLRSGFDNIVDFSGDLQGKAASFSMYEFCVSKDECFDIFISSYLPTADTPRIVVQLRSSFLVEVGVREALETSFKYLKGFLAPYSLFPVKVRENRVDYAFHTNLIHDPYKFFSDKKLNGGLKTKLRRYHKYGVIGKGITIDTFSLGDRRSNNVYFRAYNKAREVIEMNYKSFFILRWYQNGLISSFDKYVYEVAYNLKSFRTGILVGRLRWYLEYGTNSELLSECRELLKKNYINSDNCTQIEAKIDGVIPEPTTICNIEFQTKRKFYTSCQRFLDFSYLSTPVSVVTDVNRDPLLRPIHNILDNARCFVDYLTSFEGCVSFVKDRSISQKLFLERGEPYQNWWKRIRTTPIDYAVNENHKFYRDYNIAASIKKSRRLLQGQIARLAMLKRADVEDSTFEADWADAMCVLNDNDVMSIIHNKGEICGPLDYYDIRQKTKRRIKPIIDKGAVREYENLNYNEKE